MRNVIASITIFIVMIIALLFSMSYLDNVCTKLENSTLQIEKSIESNSWEQAHNHSNKFMNEWKKYSPKVSIFSNHNEIDDINNELWRLTQHISYRNGEEALASTNVIKNLLKHIVESEKINMQNLF